MHIDRSFMKTLSGIYYKISGKIYLIYKKLMKKKKAIIGLIIILIIFLTIVIQFNAVSAPQFSILNHNWNGCSKLRSNLENKGFEIRLITSSIINLKVEKKAIYVILGPISDFKDNEINKILKIVANGGVLIIADDFGKANSITLSYGVTISNKQLYDPIKYDKNPNFVKVDNFTQHVIFEGVQTILLNKPSAIIHFKYGEVLAVTSDYSWLDQNSDGEFEPEIDSASSFPIMLLTRYGNGQIITISDPSLFINDMLTLYDNHLFINNLFQWAKNIANTSVVYFDESHLGWKTKLHPIGITSTLLDAFEVLSTSFILILITLLVVIVFTVLIIGPYISELTEIEKGESKEKVYYSSYIARIKTLKEEISKDPTIPFRFIEDRFKNFLEGLSGASIDTRTVRDLYDLKLNEFVNFLKELKKLDPSGHLKYNFRIIDNFLKILNNQISEIDKNDVLMIYLNVRKLIQKYERREM